MIYFVIRGTAEEIIEFAAVLKRGMRPRKVPATTESYPGSWQRAMNTYHNLRPNMIKEAITIANNYQGSGSGKIGAIKYLRSELGCGLKEAKDMVESWI